MIVSQLVFALILPRDNPNAVIVNVLSAGLAEAGASQAGDLAFDFRVGHVVGASAKAQLYGQILGSIFGAFISCGFYKLYTSTYSIPDKPFEIPAAFMDVRASQLLMGSGLPQGVAGYALGTAIFFVLSAMVTGRFAHVWWSSLIPRGIPFAIGKSPNFRY